MKGFFDRRVFMLRRGQRHGDVQASLDAAGWPFGGVKPDPFVDAHRWPPPLSWPGEPAAWVRLQRHARIVEDALQNHVDRLIVVEAGVHFHPGLTERWQQLLSEAQPEWTVILLRNEPLAYAMQGTALRRFYQALREGPEAGEVQDRLRTLRHRPKTTTTRVTRAKHDPRQVPIVVVADLHDAQGLSVANRLRSAGVYFGEALEDPRLAKLCNRALPFPHTDLALPAAQVRAGLEAHVQALSQAGPVIGLCYPHLCAFLPHLQALFGARLRVVPVHTPLDQAIDALATRVSRPVAASIQTHLWNQRATWLGDRPLIEAAAVDAPELARPL